MCCNYSFSRVRLFVTPWSVAHQAPLPMGILGQEHWSWLPCPPPEDLPNPVIKFRFPTLQADAFPSEPPGYQGTFKRKSRHPFGGLPGKKLNSP